MQYMRGEDVIDEYKVLLDEDKKTENKGLMPEAIGIQIPTTRNVDETVIYDMSLINGLKTKFKEWKTGWKEQHVFVQVMNLMKKITLKDMNHSLQTLKNQLKQRL